MSNADIKSKFVCMGSCGLIAHFNQKVSEPRCPNCIIKSGEQKGSHVILVQVSGKETSEDFC